MCIKKPKEITIDEQRVPRTCECKKRPMFVRKMAIRRDVKVAAGGRMLVSVLSSYFTLINNDLKLAT